MKIKQIREDEYGQSFYFRSVVKEGLCEEVTFGQRADQSEEVSHGDTRGRNISGGGPASAKS